MPNGEVDLRWQMIVQGAAEAKLSRKRRRETVTYWINSAHNFSVPQSCSKIVCRKEKKRWREIRQILDVRLLNEHM